MIKKCLFPDTKPDLFFNADGICDSCISADRIHGISNSIDWDARKESFTELLEDYRGGDGYNCVVPVSGGKDSTWQVYAMKNIYGMKPLAVTFDGFAFFKVAIPPLTDKVKSEGSKAPVLSFLLYVASLRVT